MEWQPIDTAPKDGTKVLLLKMGKFGRCGMADGYFEGQRHWVWPYLRQEPTHWAPLPEAPN